MSRTLRIATFIACLWIISVESQADLVLSLTQNETDENGGSFTVFARLDGDWADLAPVRTNSFNLDIGVSGTDDFAIDNIEFLIPAVNEGQTGNTPWFEFPVPDINNPGLTPVADGSSVDFTGFAAGVVVDPPSINGGDIGATDTPIVKVNYEITSGDFFLGESFIVSILSPATEFAIVPSGAHPDANPDTVSLEIQGIPEASSFLCVGFVLAVTGGFGWWRKCRLGV